MAKFFLSLVAIGVAVLIGAIVFATFRVRDPFLRRPQSLCAAPSDPSNPLVIKCRNFHDNAVADIVSRGLWD
jgi:hypothetical protein